MTLCPGTACLTMRSMLRCSANLPSQLTLRGTASARDAGRHPRADVPSSAYATVQSDFVQAGLLDRQTTRDPLSKPPRLVASDSASRRIALPDLHADYPSTCLLDCIATVTCAPNCLATSGRTLTAVRACLANYLRNSSGRLVALSSSASEFPVFVMLSARVGAW